MSLNQPDHNDPGVRLRYCLGYFVESFGIAELQFIRVLAHLEGHKNFEVFERKKGHTLAMVCKQMDVAAAAYGIGPKMAARLAFFSKGVKNLRNNLVHNHIFVQNESLVVLKIGTTVDGRPDDVRPKGCPPVSYTFAWVATVTQWLRDFAADLDECAAITWVGGPFELPAPRSVAPDELTA